MKELLRAYCRATCIVIFTIGLVMTLVVVSVPLHLRRSWLIRWQYANARTWSRVLARIMSMRVTVKGTAPERPFILVANHLSYLDIILLFSQVNGTFIAKREVSSWPVIGLLTKCVNTIFIDRLNSRDLHRVNDIVERYLEESRGIILFPEGTSTTGAEVLPFRSSLLDLPARKNLPVHYAAIWYGADGDTAAHRHLCWHSDMTFMDHLWNALKLPRFEAQVVFGAEMVRHTNRKLLAQGLHDAVTRIFVPVEGAEPVIPPKRKLVV